MSVVTLIVVIVAVVAVVAVVGWMVVSRRHPERAARGATGVSAPLRGSADPSRVVDRPADPGAESQGPEVGTARPGPSGPPA